MQLHILAILFFGLSFLLYLFAIPWGGVFFICAIAFEVVAWGLMIADDFGKK
jgi:hypothetical protein